MSFVGCGSTTKKKPVVGSKISRGLSVTYVSLARVYLIRTYTCTCRSVQFVSSSVGFVSHIYALGSREPSFFGAEEFRIDCSRNKCN